MKKTSTSNQVEPLLRFGSKGSKIFKTIFFLINLAIAGFCIARAIF